MKRALAAVAILLAGLAVGLAANDIATEGSAPSPDPGQASDVAGVTDPAEVTGTADEVYEDTVGSVVSITANLSGGRAGGSGFVYDDSHIVTNQHVVRNASDVEVRFTRGDVRRGDVVGADVHTDLAVVEVDRMPGYAEPLPVAEEPPRRGTPVLALGSPRGLDGSMSQGIVSGVNRTSRGFGSDFLIPDTVQTDAGIDRGNSGGPLVDLSGTVVGVNHARRGVFGFSISPRLVDEVVPDLVESGETEHPYIGIATQVVSPRVAEANDLDTTRGILVVRAVEGSPAAEVLVESNRSGVPTGGDVILSADDRRIDSTEEMSRYVMLNKEPGETLRFGLLRDGERVNVSVTLDERPSPDVIG